ncbi:hypothetical protein ncot_04090 [Nocardioides sp. JQ2195]|uniref:hypothetical protein n=1 Tax=Nocardioides sp. JQ2195 TaxID=2592334 RepID=UPI00143E4CD1|nr:hypothetical protein [Nocardioides sp. JQ2195]QIX25868.1 hypothetical protein ncot_04090 [Nocardioides sp. JQ2195]
MGIERHPYATAREAADMLAVTGLPRTSVRRALAAGVAGEAIRTRGSLLYRRRTIRDLIREPLTEGTLPHPLDKGTFVLRLWFGAPDIVRFTAHQEDDARRDSISDGWHMGWQTRLVLVARATYGVPMPLLATCGGFVVVGATILGARQSATDTSTSLRLGPPDDWYEGLHHRILITPRGRPWTILPRARLNNPWVGVNERDGRA